MTDKEIIISDLQDISEILNNNGYGGWCATISKAVALLKEQGKEIKALRLLVEWATDCDFGFDQFPEEYERYKDEITDMKYIEGMIHVAKRTLEDHGTFEEGRGK